MRVVVGGQDITKYILRDTYKMDSADSYESWKDGNFVEHRIVVTDKVSGSFDICLCDKTGQLSFDDFLDLWNSAVNNRVVTIGVYVTNKNTFEVLSAYFVLSSKEHIKKGDGEIIDILTIAIQER